MKKRILFHHNQKIRVRHLNNKLINNQVELEIHKISIGNRYFRFRRIPHFFMGRFKKWAKIL